jgi:hypothetical protein
MIESKNIPTEDANSPCTLLSVADDAEAAGIVTALAAYGIQAMAVGGFVSGFKAEAPGNIQVVVRTSDFDAAKLALAEIQSNHDPVDWDSVDVGEPEE